MTHAGFWVDGAVRKPEARHADKSGWVIYKEKHDTIGHIQCSWNEVDDSMVWLDTAPRESLTPEELLSVLKVLWPKLEYVDLATDGSWCVASDRTYSETPIQWKNLQRYPPPVEPQWIRVTRENVGQYLFRECRFLDSDKNLRIGKVSGWDVTDDCCLVHSDYHPDIAVLQWNIVEVQNAPTP